MRRLFSPIEIGPRVLKNRIVVAPMCQYSAVDGQASDWHVMHLGSLAISGAGMLVIEATAVEPQGRISPADMGLWSEKQQAALAYAPGENAPHELDAAGLDRIEAAFAAAAGRADALDLAGVEIHCAHGYLLHQFLSPLANRRADAHGGALENRLRFPLRCIAAARSVLPRTRVLGVRLSATDWMPDGWDIEQSVVFARRIKELGCDYLHVSSGGLSPEQKIPIFPGYQVALAERLKREAGLPTIAVGLITEPIQAETIVATGQADLVALARGMLYDPRWPWHAAAALGAQVDVPPQYLRSQPHGLKELFRPVAKA
jgi:2,4-dienoyl-CoA reductase-like NADH-dependent reductase (Old Yellow Enzyme family)